MRCRWSDDIIQNSRREIDNTLHVDIGYFYARFSTAVDHTSNADFPFPALSVNAGNALHQLTELNEDIYMNFVTRISFYKEQMSVMPFQYLTRRLVVRSREVSPLRGLALTVNEMRND